PSRPVVPTLATRPHAPLALMIGAVLVVDVAAYMPTASAPAWKAAWWRAGRGRPAIAQLQRAQLQHFVAGRVLPPRARPLHADCHQALARRRPHAVEHDLPDRAAS